jgi:shikimate kinase
MHFCFIGMSNIGKTRWVRRVAASRRMEHISCDALIEQKLGAELAAQGYSGLTDVARWMGQPGDPQYETHSATYIECEKTVMRDVLDKLDAPDTGPCLIDTTGSVIYTGDEILEGLRQRTNIIYFEATEAHIDKMLRLYLANPKPVIWRDGYTRTHGETSREALNRCYPDLLRARAKQYSDLAHATIPFARHRARNLSLEELLVSGSAS